MRLRLAAVLAVTVSAAAISALPAQAGPAPLVITTTHTSLGLVLTTSAHRTVYLSLADPSGRSRCTGSCAAVWPPVKATGPLKATGGVKTSLLGEIALHGGGKQVTYNHHPLYYFASDSKQHPTSGEAVNGFYAVDVAGSKVAPAAAPKSGW